MGISCRDKIGVPKGLSWEICLDVGEGLALEIFCLKNGQFQECDKSHVTRFTSNHSCLDTNQLRDSKIM